MSQFPRPILTIALGMILLTPSLWVLAEVPPLWRDLDAYTQVTVSPAKATYAGHGLLYCIIARDGPLYLGCKLDAAQHQRLATSDLCLTDSGVFLLLLLQHLGLAGAAFFLIVTSTRSPWARLILGAACASVAVFYIVANCIGSETLSLICVLLLVASGLRVIRNAGRNRVIEWLVFSFLLLLCLLTRYVNFWLVLVLPLSFLATSLQIRFQKLTGDTTTSLQRSLVSKNLRQMGLALLAGITALLAASLSDHAVCRSARLSYHLRIGHTFLWRLSFWKDLSQKERDDLLERVAERSESTEVHKLLHLVGATLKEGNVLTTRVFLNEAQALLFRSETKHQRDKLDLALNEMMFALLFPPPPEYLRAVGKDFARARQITLGSVVDFFFATTTYYFSHSDTMPECASLSTFRDFDARTISAIPSRHAYLHLGGGLTYNICFFVWVAAIVLLARLNRGRPDGAAVVSYAISLISIGLLMMISSCLIDELLPRYVLPLWQMLIASGCIVIGTMLDHAFGS